MNGKVTVWQMTPEELAAYREKYPPNPEPAKKKKETAFSNIHSYGERRRKKKEMQD
ncbi:MAG: hypothetical protein ACI35R_13215 [Bacillus sp. (in: firmicutes)]